MLPGACRRALSSIVTNLIGLSACRGGACTGVSWLGLSGKSSLSEKNLLLAESGSPAVCMKLLSEKSKSLKRPDLLMLVGKALKVGTACILSPSSIASPCMLMALTRCQERAPLGANFLLTNVMAQRDLRRKNSPLTSAMPPPRLASKPIASTPNGSPFFCERAVGVL